MANCLKDGVSKADEVLKTYQVGGKPLYIIGTFDTGVTVLSQQIRALNFAWAAVQSNLVQSAQSVGGPSNRAKHVAVVGGGFAGLSLVAALLRKCADIRVTIFEQRDTLLPLQQGSDSRWLHPRIYDWPGEGSEATAAMLPVLNWTAARASDVVVRLLSEWASIVKGHSREAVTLYCNSRHLQIHQAAVSPNKMHLEWVGEERNAEDGRANGEQPKARGCSKDFDIVILAIGFGAERDRALSYWRNETLGQPSLDKPRQAFLVSGQGDGAMVDLLRLCISQFRQDRILGELFHGRHNLLVTVKELHRIYGNGPYKKGLFYAFEEQLVNSDAIKEEFGQLTKDLTRRLRRDTEVILHLRERKLSELFDLENNRISFQNKLLVYLLYKCGGFVPSMIDEKDLVEKYGIEADRVVRRHGTFRDEQLRACLAEPLYQAIASQRGNAKPDPFTQSDRELWPGGYFGYPGRTQDTGSVGDATREHWRKEYLPGPVQFLATSFCAVLSGALMSRHPEPGRLRVTLHRTLALRDEELLQQCCDYLGTPDLKGKKSTAARTFPASIATIGLAYSSRKIVRSLEGVSPEALRSAMERLSLNTASRQMSDKVEFVLAIPILQPEMPGNFLAPSPVSGVIYVDSEASNFFVNNDELQTIVKMTNQFLLGLQRSEETPYDRIINMPLRRRGTSVPTALPLPVDVKGELELVVGIEPPAIASAFQFNHDYSDFVEVKETSE